MKLSIVTINYNDAKGLRKTLKSVADQRIPVGFTLEHIIIDGASTDGSVDVIRDYAAVHHTLYTIRWVSEKDNGVYNAMNKGIEIALGLREVDSFNRSKRSEDKNKGGSLETEHFIQILNAGDILANNHVIEDCRLKIEELGYPEIMYGNMLKAMPDRKLVRDNCGGPGVGNSFLYFYRGTLNHDCAWIRSNLFDRFGLYDEDMRICSDWKWYVDAIALGGIKPVYVNIDVTVFDMNGISESGGKNRDIILKERRDYLEQLIPVSVLADYDKYAFAIEQYNRLKKYHLYGLMYFIERVLFKLEKWNILKK